MKSKLCLILLTSISLSICACNNSNEEISKEESSKSSSTSIIVAMPSNGTRKDIIEEAIKDYKEIKPDVNIVIDWKTTDNFYTSYKDSLATKINCPDAAYIDHVYVQTLAASNLIAPITSNINDSINLYVDNIVDANALNNEYYGYPFSANTICLFYNKDILKDRKVPTTYKEFLEVGQSIYDEELKKASENRNQVFSISTGNTGKEFGSFLFNSWVKRENGQILSDDLKTSYLNTKPIKDVLSKWKEIADKGFANNEASNESNFYAGKVAFIEMGCWVIPQLIGDKASGNYGVAPLFALEDNGNNSSVLGLYSLCVTNQKDSKKMEAASDFCKFLSTDIKTQLAFANDCKCLPVTKDACNDSFYQQEEWKVFVDAMPNASKRPGSPIWSTINDGISTMFIKVLQTNTSIDDATNYIHNKIQNALNAFYNNK